MRPKKIKEKCTVINCDRTAYARGYCKSHTSHLYTYGEARTLRNSPNLVRFENGTCYLTICDKHRLPIFEAMIDEEDYEKIKDKIWGFNGDYVKEGISKHVLYLHHVIIGKPIKGMVVDHRNRNKIDNRKENLHFVTYSENNRNRNKSV